MAITEGALLLSGCLAYVLHGCWLWCYRRISQKRLAEARLMLSSLLGGPTAILRQDVRFPKSLPTSLRIRVLVDLARNLDGVGRRHLTLAAHELGLLQRAEICCKSRFWWRRLEGARHLTLMGGGEGVMPALLLDENPIVRAQAAEWAADHPSPEMITMLLGLLSDDEILSRFTVQDSLVRMGTVVIEPLAQFISSQTGPPVEVALKTAKSLMDPVLLGPALIRCRDESPQVRALAADLVGVLGGTEGIEVLTDLLSDSDERVRASAARALARLHHWAAAIVIGPLLRDRYWIVRREAGMALRSLGAPGILVLRRLRSDNDPFASDMARQVLDLPDVADWGVAA